MTKNGTAKANKFAGTCSSCRRQVPAGAGLLGPKVDGRWTVRHAGCAATTTTARPAARDDHGRCEACGRRSALVTARDMSGIPCRVCRSCAADPCGLSVA